MYITNLFKTITNLLHRFVNYKNLLYDNLNTYISRD